MLDPLREFDKDILPEEPVSDGADAGDILGAQARTVAAEHVELPTENLPRESQRDTANVAVVFVHGMGTSRPGDMLESYMNPSLEWIKRATSDDNSWYLHNELDQNLVEGVNILERQRKPGRSPVSRQLTSSHQPQETETSPTIVHEVDISRLRNALLHSTETIPANFQPPYVEVDLNLRDGDRVTEKKIVALEAWWDGEFEAPPFRQVAQWALGVAPNLILRHLALVWESDPGFDEHTLSVSATSTPPTRTALAHISRWIRGMLFTVVGGLVAILFQWAIFLLLMLGSVPFLRKYVSAVILKMTTSFGDVLTYVHDGVRSAAIRSTVLRSFLWLSKNYKIEKLIVIGHSLGSVIAYDVLSTRDVVRRFEADEVTFVTFGSPLKKANLLLHLKRDEQRVSLGMLFATLSFLCAVAALFVGTGDSSSGHLSQSEWLIIVGVALASVECGVGAHMRPRSWNPRVIPYVLNMSGWQYLGVIFGTISAITMIITVDSGWRFAAILPLAGLLLWSIPVSVSRFVFAYNSTRLSQTLGFGIALLGLVSIAGFSKSIPMVAVLLLAALIFSIMASANPLEEFAHENGTYKRKLPMFSFGTAIRQWIDFWATNDVVAEFGLGDTLYRTSAEEGFVQRPKSRRVTNMNSFVVDHTTYRQNLEQFIAPFTRLMLEELRFRTPNDTAGEQQGPLREFIGHTPITGNYEQDVANTMRTRANRLRWLSLTGGLLLLTSMLFSPGVYRSLGEFIVFDERNPAGLSGTGEPIDAPGWFTMVYNEQPLVCGEILCRIRHLPVIPNDVSEQLIRNQVSGNAILYGLGYGVVFAVISFVTRIFLTIPWKTWESAILDTLLQKKTGFSFNRFVRGGAFTLTALAVLVFSVTVNNPWFGLTWVWENSLAPIQTIGAFIGWIFTPWLA